MTYTPSGDRGNEPEVLEQFGSENKVISDFSSGEVIPLRDPLRIRIWRVRSLEIKFQVVGERHKRLRHWANCVPTHPCFKISLP